MGGAKKTSPAQAQKRQADEPGKKMTPIGKISTNSDSLKDVKSGDVFSLYAHNG